MAERKATHDHMAGNGHHHAHSAESTRLPDQASDSKPFVDPVCGMKVGQNPEREISFEGEVYHFCSAKCMVKFRPAPESYLAPENSAEVRLQEAPAGTIFICPMHPEIRQPAPGNCPICGMALEPELPSLEDEENPELVDFRRRFWWTLPLTAVVFALAMFGHMRFPAGVAGQNWIELALSTPVVLWAGWPFFERWFQSLIRMSPNMWTLIGSGVMAAYGYSVVATLAPNAFPVTFASHGRIGVYFEAAAVIVSLTLLGQILELRARSQTSMTSCPLSAGSTSKYSADRRASSSFTFARISSTTRTRAVIFANTLLLFRRAVHRRSAARSRENCRRRWAWRCKLRTRRNGCALHRPSSRRR